ENTQRRCENALEELKKAFKDAGGVWEEKSKTAKFSGNISQTDTVRQLQDRINEVLDTQTNTRTNPEGWVKVKQVMKNIFNSTSPFAKVFLAIAKQQSLVYSPRWLL